MRLDMLAEESLLFRLFLMELIVRHAVVSEYLPYPSRRFQFADQSQSQEGMASIPYFFRCGEGDCAYSATYLAAWLRQQGTPACVVIVRRRGRLHALVYSGGRLLESTWMYQGVRAESGESYPMNRSLSMSVREQLGWLKRVLP